MAFTTLPKPSTPDPADAPALRWGILGTGGIAAAMADAIAAHTRQQLVAVGSRTTDTARAFADRFGIDRAHGSLKGFLSDDAVDVVYVASPHSEHEQQSLAAIAAGKHLLVEKAFCRNAIEGRRVADAARSAKVAVLEAMWTRFLPQTDILRKLLVDGALGEIITVAADHGQYFELDPSHRLFAPELAGGALLDLGIYPLSFASFVFGAPTGVFATGTAAATGVDGQVSAVLSGPGNTQAVINTTLFAVTPTTASVAGTLAGAALSGPFYAPATLTVSPRGGEPMSYDGGAIRGHRGLAYEAAHLATMIAEGRTESALMPLAETVQILQTIDEIRGQIATV